MNIEYFLKTHINNKNDRQPQANTMFNNSMMGMTTTNKNSPFRKENWQSSTIFFVSTHINRKTHP
jgi:hypothetical protein